MFQPIIHVCKISVVAVCLEAGVNHLHPWTDTRAAARLYPGPASGQQSLFAKPTTAHEGQPTVNKLGASEQSSETQDQNLWMDQWTSSRHASVSSY